MPDTREHNEADTREQAGQAAALKRLAKEHAEEHIKRRNRYTSDVALALAEIEPGQHGLSKFERAIEAGYFVEAWTTFERRPLHEAMMLLHKWGNARSYHSNPVNILIQTAKRDVAKQVMGTLRKADLVTDDMLRIYVQGIWGID